MADVLNMSLPFVRKSRADLKKRDSSDSVNRMIQKRTSGRDVSAGKIKLIEEEYEECRCKKILVVDDNNFNIMAI
jgi:hypothetical protein